MMVENHEDRKPWLSKTMVVENHDGQKDGAHMYDHSWFQIVPDCRPVRVGFKAEMENSNHMQPIMAYSTPFERRWDAATFMYWWMARSNQNCVRYSSLNKPKTSKKTIVVIFKYGAIYGTR